MTLNNLSKMDRMSIKYFMHYTCITTTNDKTNLKINKKHHKFLIDTCMYEI